MMILKDNTKYSSSKENIKDFLPLLNLANRNVSELVDEYGKSLLIYPHSFSDCDDDIDTLPVFTMSTNWDGSQCTKVHLETGNLIGFIGVQGESVSIYSRFSQNQDEDFFLHYMLQQVLNINILNLNHGTNKDQVFNFLLYFFPRFLNDALSQGLYKEYRRIEYNDANVRGTIDINKHIASNIPFKGSVAYHTREFCHDNHVTELIRHTIEYITSTKIGRTILESSAETRANVSQIISATPYYKTCDREKIISENLKIVPHPYFTRYSALQKLCVRILRHEKIKYGRNENTINGILFDVSYLWEEYLSLLLKKVGFRHPNNRKRTGRIYLAEQQKFPRYPDFIRDNDSLIIDAKYKTVAEQRDDVHQMIAYMYRLKAGTGMFIYPTSKNDKNKSYQLLGYGEQKSNLKTYFFEVPQTPRDFGNFSQQIEKSESLLCKKLVQ